MRFVARYARFSVYITGDRRIAPFVRTAIENADSVHVSVATLWEATTKYRLGKLDLPEPPHPWLAERHEEHGFETLVIEATVAHLNTLEAHHRDPFRHSYSAYATCLWSDGLFSPSNKLVRRAEARRSTGTGRGASGRNASSPSTG